MLSELKIQLNYHRCCQVLPYGQLMQELDVSNVRELEDFLINECMYSVSAFYINLTCICSTINASHCCEGKLNSGCSFMA